MKNWEAAAQLCRTQFEALKLFGIDPDAEYVAPAPQPTAEYDAGWVDKWCWAQNQKNVFGAFLWRALAAEAARRERETWVEEKAELVNDLERTRVQLAGCSVAALGCGEPVESGAYGWSASYGDVMTLRADRDRLAAELLQAHEDASEQVSDAIDPSVNVPWMRLSPDLPDYIKALENAVDKLAPTPVMDYAGIVEEAKRIDISVQAMWSAKTTHEALLRGMSGTILRLAEALAAGGGK